MLSYKSDYLKDAFIFDYYRNQEKNEIKIGFRFIFQSTLQTMKDKEVNNVLNDIIDQALSINGVTVPGLN